MQPTSVQRNSHPTTVPPEQQSTTTLPKTGASWLEFLSKNEELVIVNAFNSADVIFADQVFGKDLTEKLGRVLGHASCQPKRFSLKGARVSTLSDIFHALVGIKSLTHLNLEGLRIRINNIDYSLQERHFDSLRAIVSNNPLILLNISNQPASRYQRSFNALLESISRNSDMRVLNLNNCDLTNSSLRKMAVLFFSKSFLGPDCNLETLRLLDNTFELESVAKFANHIRTMRDTNSNMKPPQVFIGASILKKTDIRIFSDYTGFFPFMVTSLHIPDELDLVTAANKFGLEGYEKQISQQLKRLKFPNDISTMVLCMRNNPITFIPEDLISATVEHAIAKYRIHA